MDIKAKIEEIVSKIKGSKDFAASFKSDPTKAVKSMVGEEVEKDVLQKIVEGVKAKVDIDNAAGAVSKLKGLFKKKG